ncbi:hypothetical protein EAD89_18800 [Micromonospora sp. BL4]|uniref:hypothetical protein n=1 Tax=Micromonospora sp. BL4 TaxID=2478710 RepID=UPI000EF5653D|nr:hypothetical protein [Micromonospora sp. BL4]RLP87457.1 hypothetical protein EAD89_18800 [Micromonospora sp. BL4]
MPRFLRRGFAALTWLGSGTACLVLDPVTSGGWGRDGTLLLSVLAALFGGWVFWCHGGSRITAVGVYNLAFAVFVGFGGLYHALKMSTNDPGVPLLTVAAVCYFGQVTTWLFFWSGESPSRPLPDAARADARTAGWAVKYGCVLLVLALALSALMPQPALMIDSAGFVGVLLLGAGLLRGPLGRWTVFCGAVVAVAFALYFIYLFDGFGRIVIGTLALALLIVLAHRDRQRLTKAVLLLGAAPVLLFLAGIRAAEPGSPGFMADPDGLKSAVSPLYSFAQLLRLDTEGLLPHGGGATFFNASVALIPRGLWAEKPVGFGTDLVPFLSPELVGTGHSSAALWHGEWLFNFGLLGLALMIPVTGLAVRGVDRLLAWASGRPLTTPHAMGAYVAAVLAVVGLLDLVWVGSFTYIARTGGRLAVLAVLVLAVGWLRWAVPEVGTGSAFDDRTRRSTTRLAAAARGSGGRRCWSPVPMERDDREVHVKVGQPGERDPRPRGYSAVTGRAERFDRR